MSSSFRCELACLAETAFGAPVAGDRFAAVVRRPPADPRFTPVEEVLAVAFSVPVATFRLAATFLVVCLAAAFLAAAGFFFDDPLFLARTPAPPFVEGLRLPAVFAATSLVRRCTFVDAAFADFPATLVAAIIGFFRGAQSVKLNFRLIIYLPEV